MSIIFFRCNQSLCFMVRAVLTCKATTDGGNVKCRHGLSVGGLDGSLPQIFSSLQNLGIPSALSDLTLALFPSKSAVMAARKTVLPTTKPERTSQKGKRIEIKTFKKQELCE